MKIILRVEVELEHVRGPFTSKADVAQELIDEIQSTVESYSYDGDAQYDVVDASVEEA